MKTKAILSELIAISSVSGHEAAIADYIESWITTNTHHQCTRNGDNVVVYIPGHTNTQCLIFNGHIDTVAPGERERWQTDPLRLTEHKDKLYGLGASDMKGAVAAIMELAGQYEHQKPACDVYCMFVVEEETTGNGTHDTLQRLLPKLKQYRNVAAIIGESTQMMAVLGHRGNAFVTVTFEGTGGHASRAPAPYEQAVYKSYDFISSIKQQVARWNTQFSDVVLGGISVTVTAVDAGTGAMNQIPTKAVVTLDVRTIPAFHKVLDVELANWVKRYMGSMEILYPCPAGYCDPTNPIAQTTMLLAKQTEVQVTQGATDQQFFTQAGIPAVICGPGDKSVIHAPNEYIDKALLETCTDRYMHIISDWANHEH